MTEASTCDAARVGANPGTILQTSARDIGGAGGVMMDLHRRFLRRGLDSWVAVGDRHLLDPRVLELPNDAMRSRWTRALARIARGAEGRPRGGDTGFLRNGLSVISDPSRYQAILSGVEDFDFPATRGLLGMPPRTPDVLHLHNLHGYYFDPRLLPELSWRLPTVWTLHDAWLLTGHCAHPFDCPHWQTGCGDCPDLGMYVPIRKDASARNWQLKRDIVGRSRLALVSPSRWLFGMLQETLPLGDHLRAGVIPNGVDVEVFRPGDRDKARAAFEIPQAATVLLTSGEMLAENPFKDFATLRDALAKVAAEGVTARASSTLVLIALGHDSPMEPIAGVEVRPVSFIQDPAKVAQYYQAADVYVHAARAENLPLTIIEAMACGLPVVASDVGGVSELVVDVDTGILVPSGDSGAFASALTALTTDPERRETMGATGTRRVLEHFTLEREAAAYLDLYAELRGCWPVGD